MAEPIDVHVVTPDREVWSGEATFVVARSVAGELGILPNHEPVLAVLAEGPLTIRTESGDKTANVVGGFLSVSSSGGYTRVDVLAESATDTDL